MLLFLFKFMGRVLRLWLLIRFEAELLVVGLRLLEMSLMSSHSFHENEGCLWHEVAEGQLALADHSSINAHWEYIYICIYISYK